MKETIPKHLVSTTSLIKSAFPTEITDDEYLSILKILYPHMSNRNLADSVEFCTEYDKSKISNDIAKVASIPESQLAGFTNTLTKLKQAGLANWENEE